MSEVKLCRICVRKDVKMYEHDRFLLMVYYKEVTGSKISSRDCLPKWFCFECAALLHKFHEFKRRCLHGQNAFKKLVETGCTSLDNLTRRAKDTSFRPLLQILSASKNRVRTYTVQHSSLSKKAHSKKKYNIFTEVFVDDVKSDNETEILKLSIDKKVPAKSIDVTSVNIAETNHQQLLDDDDGFDNAYNDDSNDSILLLNSKDKESHIKDETSNVQKRTNHITRINVIDNHHIELPTYLERTVHDIQRTREKATYNEDRTDSDLKRTIYDKDRTESDINRTTYDKDRIDSDINRTTYDKDRTDSDINRITYDIDRTESDIKRSTITEEIKDSDKPNLDNKFQRSVKKKFLDENHWTKITLTDEEAARRFQAKALEQKYIRADYKCVDCYRTFSQEDMMKRHVKLRHCESLGPNECRHCRMRFKWKSRLQKHLKEHYTIYKCLRCELSFPVEISAFQHDYSHNGVTWTCAHCGQGFRHSSTYYTHLRKHKSKYVCTLCGVSFVSEFGLFMHKRVKHVINEDSKEESSNTYCKVCDIKFDTLKGYEDHFAESALHATEVLEGATCLPLKTRCTKKRVPRISTTCTSCGKTFSTYAAFSKHHLSAHPGLALPKSRTDKHDGQRQICEVCGLTLASAWSLVNHLNTHTRDKRYTCKTCGMQLSSRSVLQRHQLTHSQEKNFVCDMCDKRFSHRSGLRLHLRTHEKDHSPTRTRKRKSESQNVMEYFKSYGSLPNYR